MDRVAVGRSSLGKIKEFLHRYRYSVFALYREVDKKATGKVTQDQFTKWLLQSKVEITLAQATAVSFVLDVGEKGYITFYDLSDALVSNTARKRVPIGEEEMAAAAAAADAARQAELEASSTSESASLGNFGGPKIASSQRSGTYNDPYAQILDQGGSTSSVELELRRLSEESKKRQVFPSWLRKRSDFQLIFPRFAEDNHEKVGLHDMVAVIMTKPKARRSTEELQQVMNWLNEHQSLKKARIGNQLDVCSRMDLVTMDAGADVCRQGDPGDKFFVIFEGSVDVIVDGNSVGRLLQGAGFGEQALETTAARVATCRTLEPTKLFVLPAHDYNTMVSHTLAARVRDALRFLHTEVPLFAGYKYARLFQMSQHFARQTYKRGDTILAQGTACSALFVVLQGSCSIDRRLIKVKQYSEEEQQRVLQRFGYRKHEYRRAVTLHLGEAWPGDVFGEGCLWDCATQPYTVTVHTPTVDLYVLNKPSAVEMITAQTVEELKEETSAFHLSDDSLLQILERYEQQRSRFRTLRYEAIGDGYRQRTMLPCLDGRAMMKQKLSLAVITNAPSSLPIREWQDHKLRTESAADLAMVAEIAKEVTKSASASAIRSSTPVIDRRHSSPTTVSSTPTAEEPATQQRVSEALARGSTMSIRPGQLGTEDDDGDGDGDVGGAADAGSGAGVQFLPLTDQQTGDGDPDRQFMRSSSTSATIESPSRASIRTSLTPSTQAQLQELIGEANAAVEESPEMRQHVQRMRSRKLLPRWLSSDGKVMRLSLSSPVIPTSIQSRLADPSKKAQEFALAEQKSFGDDNNFMGDKAEADGAQAPKSEIGQAAESGRASPGAPRDATSAIGFGIVNTRHTDSKSRRSNRNSVGRRTADMVLMDSDSDEEEPEQNGSNVHSKTEPTNAESSAAIALAAESLSGSLDSPLSQSASHRSTIG